MDAEQLKFILKELHFSEALPEDALDKLAAASRLHPLAAGANLFREGRTNENLYLIRSGRLALEMHVPGRGAVRIVTLGPGEMVGWSSLLDQGKMTASAVAVEDSQLVVTLGEKLRELCDANSNFGFHLMRQMANALSKRLVATRLQLLDLFADSQTPPVADGLETRNDT